MSNPRPHLTSCHISSVRSTKKKKKNAQKETSHSRNRFLTTIQTSKALYLKFKHWRGCIQVLCRCFLGGHRVSTEFETSLKHICNQVWTFTLKSSDHTGEKTITHVALKQADHTPSKQTMLIHIAAPEL